MAKRRRAMETADELPGVIEPAIEPPAIETKVDEQKQEDHEPIVPVELSCIVPFIPGIGGYNRRRIDMTLTSEQSIKLRGILLGLESGDAKLANGRFVSTPSHALAWLIENAS